MIPWAGRPDGLVHMHRRRVGSCWASARSSLPGSSTGTGAAMTFGSLRRPNGYCARPVGKPPPHRRNRNGTQGPGRRCLNTSGGMLPRICYLLIPWSASPRGERHPTALSSRTAVSIAAPDGSRLYAISLRQASPHLLVEVDRQQGGYAGQAYRHSAPWQHPWHISPGPIGKPDVF